MADGGEESLAEMIERSRRFRRRAHRVAALRRWAPRVVVFGLTFAVAGWSAVSGPLRTLMRPPAAAAPVPPPGTTVPPTTAASTGPTTSSTIAIASRSYHVGDCVRWDQGASPALERQTSVVPCSDTHLIEIIGGARIPAGDLAPFPDEAQWDAYRQQLCAPMAQPYLGYPLDPAGRYGIASLQPLERAWRSGERQLWCGLGARWPDGRPASSTQVFYAFTGSVKGADQTYLFGTGTCLALTADGRFGDSVPCTQPHGSEITGTTAVTAATFPATDQAWAAAVGAACQQVTSRYVGGTLPAGVTASWLTVEESSWAAGRRVVECTAVRFGSSGHLEAASGSVRAG